MSVFNHLPLKLSVTARNGGWMSATCFSGAWCLVLAASLYNSVNYINNTHTKLLLLQSPGIIGASKDVAIPNILVLLKIYSYSQNEHPPIQYISQSHSDFAKTDIRLESTDLSNLPFIPACSFRGGGSSAAN